MKKAHLISDFRKKKFPWVGLEPMKMRQDLKKSMIMRGCAYCQRKVKNIQI